MIFIIILFENHLRHKSHLNLLSEIKNINLDKMINPCPKIEINI